jgi:hypothetical protein
MTVLLVGAGRMGLRHLRGLRAAGVTVAVVDPHADEAALDGVRLFRALEEALAGGSYEAAVLAATAAGRLERFAALTEAGINRMLVEKPLEQSRDRVHELARMARDHAVDARVNHFFRTLPLFDELRQVDGPFHLSVTGGAFGLACNGIHWLDLALYLSGDGDAQLRPGELDATPIGSGRGSRFRDYGGRGLYALAGGSRLYLSSAAASSAPMHAVLDQPARQTLLFPHEELARLLVRSPGATELPAYRYGAGYEQTEVAALEGDDLWRSTEAWARGGDAHPTVETSVRAHDLLFDLLELDGDERFPIT